MPDKSRIPMLYHTHHSQEAHDLPFWLEWANKQGGPILELGCGTGRVLLPIAEAGHTVFGLDNDAAMLDYLRVRVPDSIIERVLLIRGDLRRYCLSSSFPLILMPCNTFSTLQIKDRQIALNRVRLHLAPRGVFIISMPNLNLFTDISEEGESENEAFLPHPETGNPVQVSSQWQIAADKVLIHWHYDHLLPDGYAERISISSTHYFQDVDEILSDFETTGLDVINILGDFDQEPYDDESPNLIVVACRE